MKLRSEDKNLKDKTARSQIYNEMKPYLSGVSDEYLRKITSKARKINKLFGYDYDPITLKKIKGIGWHMVNRVTYSADSISRLTNLQIQYIIDRVNLTVTNKTVNNVHDQSHVTKKSETSEKILPKVNALTTPMPAEVSVSTAPIPLTHVSNSSDDSSKIDLVNSPKAEVSTSSTISSSKI